MNLIIKDIFSTPGPQQLLNCCQRIVAHFHHSSNANEKLKMKQAELKVSGSLVSPGNTRWASQISCIKSVLLNLDVLKHLCIGANSSQISLPKDLREIILMETFNSELQHICATLEPLADAIYVIESNDCSFGDSFKIYCKLWNNFELRSDELGIDVYKVLEKRWKDFYHPVMPLTDILNPKHMGKNIDKRFHDTDDINRVMKQLSGSEEEYLKTCSQLLMFRAKLGCFKAKELWQLVKLDEVSPLIWWKGNGFHESCPELMNLAVKVLSIPASSAGVERIFSSYGHIHNKNRNRFASDHAEQLAFIYHNLRMEDDHKKKRPNRL
jgi:hypothetical protein